MDHVAKAVLYMANLPLDANVQFMTLMATKMPYVGGVDDKSLKFQGPVQSSQE